MALTVDELEVVRRLVEAAADGREVAAAFDAAVDDLELDRYWVALNLTTAGAVTASGTAIRGGRRTAHVMGVTRHGMEAVMRSLDY